MTNSMETLKIALQKCLDAKRTATCIRSQSVSRAIAASLEPARAPWQRRSPPLRCRCRGRHRGRRP